MAQDSNHPSKRQGDGSSWVLGVDNRSHETKLADGFVRKADNVDIDENGITSTRDGYELFVVLPGAHSLWDHPLLTFALVADASKLYLLDVAGALTQLVDGLNGSPVSYGLIAHQVRWSNGAQTGQLDLDGTPAPLGVSTPLPAFVLTGVANGGLFAGRYGVSLTFADDQREEGGAPATSYVDVADGGGIEITGVPVDANGMAVEAMVYVTAANGTDLMYAGSALPGAASFTIGAGTRTRTLATQFCEPFPPAQHLIGKTGRLFGVIDRDVVWSEALYFGLWRPTKNTYRVPGKVVMLASPDSPQFVLYVGTRDKVYVLAGDSIDSCSLTVACGAGVIPGSMAMIPAEALKMNGVLTPVPVWGGSDGVPYAGLLSGVVPLSSVFAYPIYDEAAAAFVQQNGLSRYLISGRGGKVSGLSMGDHVSAEVIEAGP